MKNLLSLFLCFCLIVSNSLFTSAESISPIVYEDSDIYIIAKQTVICTVMPSAEKKEFVFQPDCISFVGEKSYTAYSKSKTPLWKYQFNCDFISKNKISNIICTNTTGEFFQYDSSWKLKDDSFSKNGNTGSVAFSVVKKSGLISVDNKTFSFSIGGEMRGDSNFDGYIDMRDALNIQKYLMNIPAPVFNTIQSDTTYDSAINLKDVLLLRKCMAGIESAKLFNIT